MENKFRNDKIIIIFIVILEFLFWEHCILIYLLFQENIVRKFNVWIYPEFV